MTVESAAVIRERLKAVGVKTRYNGSVLEVTYPDGKVETYIRLDDLILKGLEESITELRKMEENPETIKKSWKKGYKELTLG